MSRISIFGSCITRDVFRLFPEAAEIASYHSRSSLISLMSPPLDADDTGTHWPSNFARKVVLADFRKSFFDDLEAVAPHCGYRLERVARETETMHATWLEQSERFAHVLRSRFPELPVILHKAYWTPRYRDGRAIRRFSREWRSWISRRNEMLEACHAQLERVLPGLATVEPRQAYLADPGHRWGLGSSHYEPGYYDDIREQMLSNTTAA